MRSEILGGNVMSQLTLDSAFAKQLHALGDIVELLDPAGNLLGRFVPADTAEYERMEPPMDEAELARREKSTKWHTTAEVLAHLQSLE
jgi:hypothetical protein